MGYSVTRSLCGSARRRWLGILFVSKYFNLFMESGYEQIRLSHDELQPGIFPISAVHRCHILTFQAVAYIVDIWRRYARAEPDQVNFFLFITFFPQLGVGPIERAANR